MYSCYLVTQLSRAVQLRFVHHSVAAAAAAAAAVVAVAVAAEGIAANPAAAAAAVFLGLVRSTGLWQVVPLPGQIVTQGCPVQVWVGSCAEKATVRSKAHYGQMHGKKQLRIRRPNVDSNSNSNSNSINTQKNLPTECVML
eukprot:COSAG02_NODE_795_length_17133_cov_6.577727_7_plen_141_part_00